MRSVRILILSFLAVLPAASDFPIDALLEPPEAPWHRSIAVELSVQAPASAQITFPDVAEKKGQVQVRKSEKNVEHLDDGTLRHRQQYVIDPLSAGNWLFPPLNIGWADGENTGVLESAPLAFTARELTPEEKEFASHFEGLTSPSFFLKERRNYRWLYLFPVLAAAAVCVLLALWWKRRRAYQPALPPLPPWTMALNRLRELQTRDLPGQGRSDLYYVDLSAIMRYYFEDRSQIPAPEQTTPELLEAAQKETELRDDQHLFLKSFLRQCDRVKFARYNPGIAEMEEHFTGVKTLVQQTIPDTVFRTEGDDRL